MPGIPIIVKHPWREIAPMLSELQGQFVQISWSGGIRKATCSSITVHCEKILFRFTEVTEVVEGQEVPVITFEEKWMDKDSVEVWVSRDGGVIFKDDDMRIKFLALPAINNTTIQPENQE